MVVVIPICTYSSIDRSFLPWPVRVFECQHCVVELTMVSTRDNLNQCSEKFGNHSAWLCYYSIDGSCKRLDLRKNIRKKLKNVSRGYYFWLLLVYFFSMLVICIVLLFQVVLHELENSPLSDKIPILDKIVESGRFIGLSVSG